MKDKRKFFEHEDLEDRIYISTNIEFDTQGATFEGMNPLEIEIKKKKPEQKIEKIEHGKSRGELF